MDLTKRYQDEEGNPRNILEMVGQFPEWAANRIQEGEKAASQISALEAKCRELERQLEFERMRLASCGVAALANTRISAADKRLAKDSIYISASYQDVCRLADSEMELREQLAALQRIIDGYKDDLLADTPTEKKLFNDLANSWHKKAVEDAETIKELKDQIKVMQALSGETITEKPSVTATQYSPCGECENCYRSLPCPEEEKQCN